MSKLEVGETPEQFVERLNRYLVKWCEMAGYDNDYDGLKRFIIRDQFFVTCDRQLQTFLKEKGKLSLKKWPKQPMTSMKPMDTQVIVMNLQRDQMAT